LRYYCGAGLDLGVTLVLFARLAKNLACCRSLSRSLGLTSVPLEIALLKLMYLHIKRPSVQGIFTGYCIGGEMRLKGQGVRVTGGIAFWRGFRPQVKEP